MNKLFLLVCAIFLFFLYGFSSAFAQTAASSSLSIVELLQQQVQALLLQVQTLQQQVIELRSELRESNASSPSYASTVVYPSRASFLANLLTALVSALRELEMMLAR